MTNSKHHHPLRRSLTAIAAVTLLLVAAPTAARAGWGGTRVETGRVTVVSRALDDQWRIAVTRHAALWTARIEALLPQGINLSVEQGTVELWSIADPEFIPLVSSEIWEEEDMGQLFLIVADLVEANAEDRGRAMEVSRRPLTVQVAATTSDRVARELARLVQENLREEQLDTNGFVEYAGAPAWNDSVWITSHLTPNGRRRYQVIVGAFVDEENARLVLERTREVTGLEGFVRFL